MSLNLTLIEDLCKQVVYNTIPYGDVLERVKQVKYRECTFSWTGCKYCIMEDPSYEKHRREYDACMKTPCKKGDLILFPAHCITYSCDPVKELPYYHTIGGEPQYTKTGGYGTNLICGTTLNVTVAGCYCKPEYQWRDIGSLKCVKSC